MNKYNAAVPWITVVSISADRTKTIRSRSQEEHFDETYAPVLQPYISVDEWRRIINQLNDELHMPEWIQSIAYTMTSGTFLVSYIIVFGLLFVPVYILQNKSYWTALWPAWMAGLFAGLLVCCWFMMFIVGGQVRMANRRLSLAVSRLNTQYFPHRTSSPQCALDVEPAQLCCCDGIRVTTILSVKTRELLHHDPQIVLNQSFLEHNQLTLI